jgi:hypothetical protein
MLLLTELSEAYWLVGRVDEGRTLAERLLTLFHSRTKRGYQAHAWLSVCFLACLPPCLCAYSLMIAPLDEGY